MAFSPSRSVRWSTWFVIVALVGILIGCNRRQEPPAVAEAQTDGREKESRKEEANFKRQADEWALSRSELDSSVSATQ